MSYHSFTQINNPFFVGEHMEQALKFTHHLVIYIYIASETLCILLNKCTHEHTYFKVLRGTDQKKHEKSNSCAGV